MFDSHCHLDDDAYDQDRQQVIARARQAGVLGILVPGYEPKEWPLLGEFCRQAPGLACGVGLHPWYVHTLTDSELERALADLSAQTRLQQAVAVGECGLDGHKARHGGAPMVLQQRVLERHLDVADELSLPVILHCVDAHGALVELLERRGPLKRGGVMHSYSGPAELVPRYARLGLYFGFAGIVTRDNAKRPRRALISVPLERLLVESDGPDQVAAGVEGRRSEPAHIVRVLESCASLRPETLTELARATAENARILFAL
jgi:TatD DNase family protein